MQVLVVCDVQDGNADADGDLWLLGGVIVGGTGSGSTRGSRTGGVSVDGGRVIVRLEAGDGLVGDLTTENSGQLVADDDGLSRERVDRLLANGGCLPLSVENGEVCRVCNVLQ